MLLECTEPRLVAARAEMEAGIEIDRSDAKAKAITRGKMDKRRPMLPLWGAGVAIMQQHPGRVVDYIRVALPIYEAREEERRKGQRKNAEESGPDIDGNPNDLE